jgi:hypothetical protein
MESKQFKSSRITNANYDPEGLELVLYYTKGGAYQYREVPPEVWEGLIEAESPGKFINNEIRGKFDYRKL